MKIITVFQKGFTIVELLIVVVIIAILASITLVTYNGIRDRADNTAIISGVKQYLGAVEAYYAFHGEFPSNSRMLTDEHIAMSCLGSGYPNDQCGIVSGQNVHVDSYFDNSMRNVIKSTPPIGKHSVGIANENFVGAAYGVDVTGPASSTGRALTIQYALIGSNTDCGIEQAYAYETSAGNTACEIILKEEPNN